jgi:adenine-specific DNA methylase
VEKIFEGLYLDAKKEGNSRKPIYQLHKWWARRPSSVFRALLVTGLSSSRLSTEEIMRRYRVGYDYGDNVVLDPFMGGGTTIIEGLRLGCKVIGVDVNPVAWFVTKKEIDHFDSERADKIFSRLERKVGKKILSYYSTRCPSGHEANIIYAIWRREIACPRCGRVSTLDKDSVIFEKDGVGVILCPNCGWVGRRPLSNKKPGVTRMELNSTLGAEIPRGAILRVDAALNGSYQTLSKVWGDPPMNDLYAYTTTVKHVGKDIRNLIH